MLQLVCFIIWIALLGTEITLTFILHGTPRKGYFNVWSNLVNAVITGLLLWGMGAFDFLVKLAK